MIQRNIFIVHCIHALCITMLVVSIGCTKAKQSSPKQDNPQQTPRKRRNTSDGQKTKEYVYIQAQTVTPSRIHQKITISARVKSSAIVHISSQTDGVITRMRVQEGARIKKGSVILYVDASRSGTRYRPSPIIAPIAGIVSNLPVKVGNKVSIGTTVATVVDTSNYKVHAAVPASYARSLRVGMHGILKLRSFLKKDFPLVMSEVSPKINAKTGSVDITLVFNGAVDVSALISGMYGTLDLTLEVYENEIVIERHTLVLRNNADGTIVPGVFRVDEPANQKSSVSFVPITTGIEELDTLQVLKGLALGDVIVTIGQTHLRDKDTVVVSELDGVMRSISESIHVFSETE